MMEDILRNEEDVARALWILHLHWKLADCARKSLNILVIIEGGRLTIHADTCAIAEILLFFSNINNIDPSLIECTWLFISKHKSKTKNTMILKYREGHPPSSPGHHYSWAGKQAGTTPHELLIYWERKRGRIVALQTNYTSSRSSNNKWLGHTLQFFPFHWLPQLSTLYVCL